MPLLPNDILGEADETTQRQYSYHLVDVRNNEVMAELPFMEVSYETVLSAPGEFSGSITVNEDVNGKEARSSTIPGRSALYVLRDGRPMWGGMIWKRRYNASSRKATIVASTFESYLGARLQPVTLKFTNTDQLDIARWLLENDDAAADILASVSDTVSPRKRERQFYAFEHNTVLDELTRLGDLIDGFDWNVIIGRHPQSAEITRTFEFFYPKRGVTAEASELLFEYPGSVRDFDIDEDATAGGNVIYALGAGEGIDQKIATATVADQLSAGYPKLELTRSYSSVIEQATLQAHADSDRDRLTAPVTVFEVTVDAKTEPELGSYEVGDWARFKLQDDFMTPGIDQYARITAIQVSVEDSTGLEQVKITLGGEEVTSDEEDGTQ